MPSRKSTICRTLPHPEVQPSPRCPAFRSEPASHYGQTERLLGADLALHGLGDRVTSSWSISAVKPAITTSGPATRSFRCWCRRSESAASGSSFRRCYCRLALSCCSCGDACPNSSRSEPANLPAFKKETPRFVWTAAAAAFHQALVDMIADEAGSTGDKYGSYSRHRSISFGRCARSSFDFTSSTAPCPSLSSLPIIGQPPVTYSRCADTWRYRIRRRINLLSPPRLAAADVKHIRCRGDRTAAPTRPAPPPCWRFSHRLQQVRQGAPIFAL